VDQHARGLIACPVCGLADVQRLPSAPRLNLSGAQPPAESPKAKAPAVIEKPVDAQVHASASAGTPDSRARAESAYLQAVRNVLANTEDVGPRFAEEARRIHHGEVESRHIRGQTSPEEARALHDEGIEVLSLQIPVGLDRPLQ
jgi:hypothetical protein